VTRARYGSWLLGVALLLLFVSRPISAIGPAYIVVHGGALRGAPHRDPFLASSKASLQVVRFRHPRRRRSVRSAYR